MVSVILKPRLLSKGATENLSAFNLYVQPSSNKSHFQLSTQIHLLSAHIKMCVLDWGKMCEWFPHRERLHTHTVTVLMVSERKTWSNDFGHSGRHRVSEKKKIEREKTGKRWEDQTSQQLAAEHGTEVTARRGLSESLLEATPGMVEELLVCWDREGQRERQHTSFCYCVGEEEKDGGIILMA